MEKKDPKNGNNNGTITLTSRGHFCSVLPHSVTDKDVHTMLYMVNKMYT